jgi:hypothetical protein
MVEAVKYRKALLNNEVYVIVSVSALRCEQYNSQISRFRETVRKIKLLKTI